MNAKQKYSLVALVLLTLVLIVLVAPAQAHGIKSHAHDIKIAKIHPAHTGNISAHSISDIKIHKHIHPMIDIQEHISHIQTEGIDAIINNIHVETIDIETATPISTIHTE